VTFSIVARDPATGDLGVAVASKFLAVGSVVPWARAGVGALATQALANVTYGPAGLAALAAGEDARSVVERLTAADDGRTERQLGVVDAHGGAASHTGSGCLTWAGGRTADGVAIQGNILAGPAVVEAMSPWSTMPARRPSWSERRCRSLIGANVQSMIQLASSVTNTSLSAPRRTFTSAPRSVRYSSSGFQANCTISTGSAAMLPSTGESFASSTTITSRRLA
jgi:hypothetical protein